jgi:outer membrane protein assembly factor BamB
LTKRQEIYHEIRCGLYLDPSGPFFVLGQGALYVPVATPVTDSAIVRLDLNNGQSHLLLAVEDFAATPLAEQGNVLIVRAKRTRGSERTELWGLDKDSGERFWRHELQANVLLNVDPGIGQEWAYHFTSRGLAVIQFIPDPPRLLVQMIDVPTGQVGYETSSRLDNDFWAGVIWTSNTAYLTIRNLYAVDLATGEATLEWP